ncbi:MAG: TRAP transporter fused permease subunit [Rhodospirillaceae bacterium]|jgi:TRAP transporter 4TM/12TM fusion protein|nr:TRAP transporter fused permease subunit [Rhodospirillaceae bacterium]MBT3884401.1 TRAP transporter fused permease subunit [Rhodospirillaceae bacterium]MBT4116688.1 TRAP transporter fused permease subunit [Rhodospirillaceae bacterium]MBT4673305.1 TRAP transporter fused permease subunit [Rhodospirillaceae bacterium]MBT4720286.1 TRAP transporter fused permease subunit [Rhodospirillaceae bacterium]
MNTTTAAAAKYLQIGAMLATVLGLAMAITAMANSMPSVWIIPKFGPFKAEFLRGGMLSAAVTVVLLARGFTRLAIEKEDAAWRRWLFVDAAILAGIYYVSWQFSFVTIEIQDSLFFFEESHAWITLLGIGLLIILCWRVWGAPLAVFGLVLVGYYFFGQYMPSIFKVIPMSFVDNFSEDIWFNLNKGVLGQVFEIVVFTVFPFIIFGAMLEATGVGGSLIRFAFIVTRNTRGGPAHAAVLASSLFGTMSGVPVANVVGTGVMTIPLIKKRGFTPTFAGAIEATASTGGQIMPPIMGAAALIMADIIQVSYLVIITAALIPALLYYLSLFFTVTFESRRLDIDTSTGAGDLAFDKHDIVNLVILAGAITVIISTLLFGLSAAAAGVFVVLYLVPASFFSTAIRRNPAKILQGFAKGGIQFSELLMAIGVVGIVLSVLNSTGLPLRLANSVEVLMEHSLFIALVVAGVTAIIFGMGMPTLPAYLTIILILGPTMLNLGLDILVAHMFVFYFGVSSSITPPVAIAAYAGASIAGSGPMRTGFMAIRIGAAIILVPFIFAYNPELLLVEEAGGFETFSLISILARTVVAIWLMTSAFSRYDATQLSILEMAIRFALVVVVLMPDPAIHWAGFAAGLALIGYNNLVVGRRQAVDTG